MKKYLGFATVILSLLFIAKAANAQSYEAYLTSAQEVPANASTGSGKARIVINPTALTVSFNITFTGLSSAQILGHIHGPAPVGTNTGVQITFPVVGGTSGTISGSTAITATQIAQIKSGQGYVNIHTSNFNGGELRGQLARNRPVDFDGDGRTDLSVLRFPAAAPLPITYYNRQSTAGDIAYGPFGDAGTDFPTPGDYDGDGKDDLALYRSGVNPGADSMYLILYSATNTFQAVLWGVTGDRPIARDYDGDGITDMACFRPGATVGSNAFWFIRQTASNFVQRTVQWGTTGDNTNTYDTPVPADYDGDGKVDLAVYRFGLDPADHFIILRSSTGTAQFVQWGTFFSDYILPGDYDGDGKADFCAARTGAAAATPVVWYIKRSSDGGSSSTTFGRSDDLPIQGDYDGDGKTDIAMYRRGAVATAQSTFYVLGSFTNQGTGTAFGLRADFPVCTFDAR